MRRIRVIYIFERSEVFTTAVWPENHLFLNNLKGCRLVNYFTFATTPSFRINYQIICLLFFARTVCTDHKESDRHCNQGHSKEYCAVYYFTGCRNRFRITIAVRCRIRITACKDYLCSQYVGLVRRISIIYDRNL